MFEIMQIRAVREYANFSYQALRSYEFTARYPEAACQTVMWGTVVTVLIILI